MNIVRISVLLKVVVMLVLAQPVHVSAEQMIKLGNMNVHYIVVPTMFFNKKIAEQYKITRGKDRALMNISVLNSDQQPIAVTLDGHMTNLLGQQQTLNFTEVREGVAIYYLAPIKYSDREVLRFTVNLSEPGATPQQLKFQQKMYLEDR